MKPSEKFWRALLYVILGIIGLVILIVLVYYWQITLTILGFIVAAVILGYLWDCMNDTFLYYPSIEKYNQKDMAEAHPDCRHLHGKAKHEINPKYNFLWKLNDWLNRNYKEESN